MNVQVTTAIDISSDIIARAKQYAQELEATYIRRGKKTMRQVYQEAEHTLVVNRDRLLCYNQEGQVLFFHPNTAWLRILNGRDPLIEAIAWPGARVLDATMGMASDSIVMQAFGYQVTALESNPLIHLIVSQGLAQFELESTEVNEAMRQIKTYCQDYRDFLRQVADKSYDVIYFDPMFKESIQESKNLDGIRTLANPLTLSAEMLQEAKRVAKHRIVLKAHFRDPIFEVLGFERLRRPNTKFHYGFISLEEETI